MYIFLFNSNNNDNNNVKKSYYQIKKKLNTQGKISKKNLEPYLINIQEFVNNIKNNQKKKKYIKDKELEDIIRSYDILADKLCLLIDQLYIKPMKTGEFMKDFSHIVSHLFDMRQAVMKKYNPMPLYIYKTFNFFTKDTMSLCIIIWIMYLEINFSIKKEIDYLKDDLLRYRQLLYTLYAKLLNDDLFNCAIINNMNLFLKTDNHKDINYSLDNLIGNYDDIVDSPLLKNIPKQQVKSLKNLLYSILITLIQIKSYEYSIEYNDNLIKLLNQY